MNATESSAKALAVFTGAAESPVITVRAYPNPLHDDCLLAEVGAGQTVAEILGRTDLPAICIADGRVIECDEWSTVVPQQSLEVRRIPAGGDTGRIIGTIAVLALAVWAGPMLAGALFQSMGVMVSATMVGFTGGLISAGIGIAGTLLLNQLIPPPSIGGSSAGQTQQLGWLTAQSNLVGAFAPVPVLYGRMRYHPPVPMTGLPYTEIVGQDQYFRALYVLGYGPLLINGISTADGLMTHADSPSAAGAIRIADTAIDQFEDVEWQIGNPEDVTLFTSSVVEVAVNVTMPVTGEPATETWVADGDQYTQTTDTDTDEISIDIYFPALFSINEDNGRMRNAAVRFKVEAQKVSSSPIGAWTTLVSTWQVDNRSRSPVRVGRRFILPSSGQWTVRLTRVETYVGKRDQYYADAVWTAFRSIKRNSRPFSMDGVVVMAIRIRASDQLGGRLERLSVEATRILPVWDTTVSPNAWVDQATRNPAWAYVDVLTGSATRNALAKSRIDVDTIKAWADWCETEGLYCDAVVDSVGTVFDRARDVASTGLATWHVSDDGSVSIVRDVVSDSRMVVSPRNAVEFGHEYTYPDVPHCLRVQFVDPDRWETTERLVYADGYDPADSPHTTPTRFEQLQLFGVTDADQAWKIGRYHMAQLTLRPERFIWRQDIGHLVYARGDCVDLQHDVITVGIRAARVKAIGSPETAIEVDDWLPMQTTSPLTTYGVRAQLQDGSIVSRTISTVAPGTSSITLSSAISGLQVGDLLLFGESAVETIKAKIIRIEPQGDFQARITAVPAADDIYDAWTGTIPTFDPVITEPIEITRRRPPTPTILDVLADPTTSVRDSAGELRIRMAVIFEMPSSEIGGTIVEARIRDKDLDRSTSPRTTVYSEWRYAGTIPAREGVAYIDGVEEEQDYQVQVRAIRAELASAWSPIEDYTVPWFGNPTVNESLRLAQEASADAHTSLLNNALVEPTIESAIMPIDMRLWLRSEDATESSPSTGVASWPDHSNAAEPVTIANAPTIVPAELNGFPVVRFDGSTDYLTADGLADVFNGDDLPFSLFALCKPSSLAADKTIFSAGRSSSDGPFMSARARTSVNTWGTQRRGDDLVLGQASAITDSIDTSTWSLLAVVFDGTNLTAYVNGRRMGDPSALTAGSMTINQVSIGCRRGSTNQLFWQGDLAELILYDYALTPPRRHAVEQYLRERYDIDIGHRYYVDTVTGSDSNAGMTAASPLATYAEAYGRLGSIGGTVLINAPEATPIREELNLNVARRIVLDATDARTPWHWYGTTQHTSGWTSAGGSVWYKAITDDPVAHIFITTLTSGDFFASLTNVGDTTTPAEGEYGYNVATGRVYLRMPASQDPNSHTLEVSTVLAPIRVSNNRSAPLVIKNGVVRGGRTGCIVGTATGLGGLTVIEDTVCQFGNNNVAIQPAGGFAGMLCRRVTSQKAWNDGFNLHNDALLPCYMRLEDCEASYNGDEGASPHDSAVMDIIGGTYQFNGSAGVTAIQNALLRVFGATFNDNSQTIGPSLTEGGIYYADSANGYVISATVEDNDGPGLYVQKPGLVEVSGLVSTGNTYSDTY